MTVGLFGGAFDPPHNGHVALARTAVDRFALARLLVLVVAAPGHKRVPTDVEHRLALTRLAFDVVAKAEVVRDDHAYTIDSVRDARFDTDDALFLVGADEFGDFLSWREPDAILARVRVGVATRPGYPREHLEPVLEQLERPDRVELFEIPAVPVSSTEIRARAARGEPLGELVPPAVARLVDQLGLYREGFDRRRGEKLR